MKKIEISDVTFELLQKFAIPLEDTPDTIIRKLAEQALKAGQVVSSQTILSHIKSGKKNREGGPYPWSRINFKLPNADLSRIWGINYQSVKQRRTTHKLGPSAWPFSPDPVGEYKEAMEREKLNVIAYNESKPPPEINKASDV